MTDPVSLYIGETTHHRFGPRPHRFRYRIFQLLVDLDRIETSPAGVVMFRIGRWGLFSFSNRDHGFRDGAPLRPWVEAQLRAAGLQAQACAIRLLCFPRILGFVFNPLSIVFIHDEAGRLEAVIYEVNNTFGQTHAYVVPTTGAAVERHAAAKALYVSPFYRVEGGYRFRLEPPGETFDLTIVKQTGDHPDFNARMALRHRPLTDLTLLKLFVTMPFMTLGVVAAIHWQALRLWLKGAPFGARARGPKAGVSLGRLVAEPRKGAKISHLETHQA